MNTLEIEILRRELLRDILNVDDVEVLKKIRRALLMPYKNRKSYAHIPWRS